MTEAEERYAFFHEIGLALREWASVENQLRRVASACITDPAGRVGIELGFLSIENFRSKLAFVDTQVVQAMFFEDQMLARWKVLFSKASSCASRRNEIAHFQAFDMPAGSPGERIGLCEVGFFLKPTRAEPATAKRIFIKDVAEQRLRFTSLSRALEDYRHALYKQPEPHGESLEQEVHRPMMAEIENRMREALGRQPRLPRK